MHKIILAGTAAISMFVSGCQATNGEFVGGAVGAAAGGLIAKEVLEANDEWTIAASLAGAAAGVMVARNTRTQQCAYSRGDGTYYTAACP
jgi:hypothetical protein